MSYLGYYQLGDEVYLPVLTSSSINEEVEPSEAPVISIFNSIGALEANVKVPKINSSKKKYHFGAEYYLKYNLYLGKYTAIISYQKNGVFYSKVLYFDVYNTGDINGGPMSMTAVKFENANFLISQLSSGVIIRGKLNEL